VKLIDNYLLKTMDQEGHEKQHTNNIGVVAQYQQRKGVLEKG
jgi:hypothetical protein